MNPFSYTQATDVTNAISEISRNATAHFIAGGTNLIDLMKENVARPNRLIDITHLLLNRIEDTDDGGLRLGALVTNAETAYTARRATQAQNTMHDSGIVLCGGGSAASGRWGDYEANVGDTSGSQNYTWFSGMNAIGGGAWGTCIGKDGFTAINQP